MLNSAVLSTPSPRQEVEIVKFIKVLKGPDDPQHNSNPPFRCNQVLHSWLLQLLDLRPNSFDTTNDAKLAPPILQQPILWHYNKLFFFFFYLKLQNFLCFFFSQKDVTRSGHIQEVMLNQFLLYTRVWLSSQPLWCAKDPTSVFGVCPFFPALISMIQVPKGHAGSLNFCHRLELDAHF